MPTPPILHPVRRPLPRARPRLRRPTVIDNRVLYFNPSPSVAYYWKPKIAEGCVRLYQWSLGPDFDGRPPRRYRDLAFSCVLYTGSAIAHPLDLAWGVERLIERWLPFVTGADSRYQLLEDLRWLRWADDPVVASVIRALPTSNPASIRLAPGRTRE